MQSILWYANRIKTMSHKEIIWRVKLLSAALVEQLRVKLHLLPRAKFNNSYQEDGPFSGAFSVFIGDIRTFHTEWRQPLFDKADKILAHKISYFNLQDHFLGDPINWHKDHASGQQSCLSSVFSIDYRDVAKNGDCKLVWEPNRHHQLVVLARAYKVSGDIKYAQGVVTQLKSWLDANPYGYGMNWCNPLELGIRMINWVWAIDLILDSGLFTGQFKTRILNSVYLHCRDISGKFSQGSSANNHLVGEAAGVYIAASYFSIFRDANSWRTQSKTILEREIQAQTFADGCSKEHGFGYQFFVYQFYLFSSQVGHWQQDDFSTNFTLTLGKLAEFIALIAQGGHDYPMLGDQDDGYALDLGDPVHDINALCDLATYLYDKDIFNSSVHSPSESAFWLFNQRLARHQQTKLPASTLQSQQFAASGYYLLQAGSLQERNQVSVLFDCAELGYTSIAAHGHADALSLIMRLNGIDLLVDSGTYDYYSFPDWRCYFRKTRAHNTIEIDGLDQSLMTGSFMWQQHAKARCTQWQPTEVGGTVSGEHSGYQRLDSPVLHQRKLTLNADKQQLQIYDQILTEGEHQITLYFHLSEYCAEVDIADNVCTLVLANNRVSITLPDNLTIQNTRGRWDSDPKLSSVGWVSRGYHQRTAINTLIATGSLTGRQKFRTLIEWC